MTQPVAVAVEKKEATAKSQGFRLTKGWFVTIFACALVGYVVIKSNGEVKQVKVGPAELSFGPLGATAKEKLESVASGVKQGETPPAIAPVAPPTGETQLAKLEELAKEQPPPKAAAGMADVLGNWHDKDGAQIQITPLGGNLLMYTETSMLYGVPIQSALGQGTWTNGRFEFGFNTLYGVPGVAVLQPGPNQTLVGNAFIEALGTNVPLALMR